MGSDPEVLIASKWLMNRKAWLQKYDNLCMTSQHQAFASELNQLTQKSRSPKILLVKLSSLGDVLHNLPIVWDIRTRLPNAQIDWIVEEAYVHLLEPLKTTETFTGIDRIIPIAFRRWRKNLFSRRTWREFFAMRKLLHAISYDVLLETQGLLKSALVCALAKKSDTAIVTGLGNATEYSGYESMARMFYTQLVPVPVKCHAVDRSRWVMCSAFNWPLPNRNHAPPRFYPEQFMQQLPPLMLEGFEKTTQGAPALYIMCFHATARAAKCWPIDRWIELGKVLSNQGYQLVLPWGNESEMQVSQLIASQVPGAIVPRALTIKEISSLITHSVLTIGVDTGLTHLSAVLGKPTVEIYCDSPKWKTEGYWSPIIANLGDMKQSPSTDQILEAINSIVKR